MPACPALIRRLANACLGLALLTSLCSTSLAQQPSCTVVANVVTEQPSPAASVIPSLIPGANLPPDLWLPARGLSPESFVAREGRHRVPVLSVEMDTGPRRILFVVAFGNDWRKLVRAKQDGQAEGPEGRYFMPILSAARPVDSFALMAVGGPRLAIPFGSSLDSIRAGLEALSPPDPDAPAGPDAFSGLLEATAWFGAPKTGDTIFLFGDMRPWRRAKASQVRAALINRSIRLFVLGGGTTDSGVCPPGLSCLESLRPDGALAEATGGAWEQIDRMGPKRADENRLLEQTAAKALYEMATFAYVLRLAKAGPTVRIELSHKAFLQPPLSLGEARFSYPRPLPVCPPPTAPATAKPDANRSGQ